MGLSQFPAPTLTAVAATYGATAFPAHSVAAGATYITAASAAFTSVGASTNWLFEVDADLTWPVNTTGGNYPFSFVAGARVDGGDYSLGAFGLNFATSAGYEILEFPVRGRFVLTLAAGSHTAVAAVYNRSGGLAVTVNAITITATQLAS